MSATDTVTVACPACGTAGARRWHARYACAGCGLLWVAWSQPPMSPAERYQARRAMDEAAVEPVEPVAERYWVRRPSGPDHGE